jgi:hypothetical protein
MKSFLDHLDEVKFSSKRINSVLTLLASLASKKVGSEFKRLEGSIFLDVQFKKADGIKGSGALYMNEKGQMLRIGVSKGKGFENKSNELNTFDFWEAGMDWSKPSRSAIAYPHYNIIDVVNDVLLYVIKGNYPIKESLDEAATQVKSGSKLFLYALSKGWEAEDAVALTQHSLKSRLNKSGDWDNDEFRGYKKISSSEVNSVKVNMKKADKILADRKYADPDLVFNDIEDLAKVVASGAQNSMIVAGMAGIGKTYHIEKTLESMFGSPDGPNARWRHYKGAKLSVFGLYNALYQNRTDMTIVFDDSDSVWKDAHAVNILKSALDTYEKRKLSWTSKATFPVQNLTPEERLEYEMKVDGELLDPDSLSAVKLPSEFIFTSRVIFISNLPPNKIDSAIQSRSLFIDVNLTRESVILRIKSILKVIHLDVSDEEKFAIVDALSENSSTLTMRAVEAAMAIKKAGINDWERLVSQYV